MTELIGGGALMVLRLFLRRGLVYILPLAALLLALGARVAAPDLLDRLMLISFDLYQRIAPRASTDSPVRIVDIDNNSLKQYGQWQWPRSLDAQLVDRLRTAATDWASVSACVSVRRARWLEASAISAAEAET